MARLKAATDFNAPRAKVWEFVSDSNPDREPYQTVLYTNGTVSCNCKGWTRQTAYGGGRTCRHVAMIEMGTADENCKAQNDYRVDGLPSAVASVLKENQEKAEAKNISFGKRKLAI
jgi:hypothetical protein